MQDRLLDIREGMDKYPFSDVVLQHISVMLLPIIFFIAPLFTTSFAMYILFFTKYYPIVLLIYMWIIIDHNTCQTEGRKWKWIRSLKYYEFLKNYFPQKLVKTADLPADKNYICCCFPHGILCSSGTTFFLNDDSDFYKQFPNLNFTGYTMGIYFYAPFTREYFLGLGLHSVSKKAIVYQLNKPKGELAVIYPGGVSELMKSSPGEYRLAIKNRKGFIKISLLTGASLVPMFSFREVDLYHQWKMSNDSLIGKVFNKMYKLVGFRPFFFYGDGFLNLLPSRIPVTSIVGKPISVIKTENPSEKEVDELHQKFINELTDLFEENKHNYLDNADGIHLIFED